MNALKLPNRADCKEFEEMHRFATVPQTQTYWQASRPTVMKMAEQAGAVRRCGGMVRIDLLVMCEYYEKGGKGKRG